MENINQYIEEIENTNQKILPPIIHVENSEIKAKEKVPLKSKSRLTKEKLNKRKGKKDQESSIVNK